MDYTSDMLVDYFKTSIEEKRSWPEELKVFLEDLKRQKKGEPIGRDHTRFEVIKEVVLLTAQEKLEILQTVIEALIAEDTTGEITPPFFVRNLTAAMLEPLLKEPSHILHPFSGYGLWAADLRQRFPEAKITSATASHRQEEIQNLLFTVCEQEILVEGDEILKCEKMGLNAVVFASPFGRKVEPAKELSLQSIDTPPIKKMDYSAAVMLKALDCLRDGGVVCGLVSPNLLFDSRQEPLREMFLDAAQVLAVIQLPEKPYPGTSIEPALLLMRRRVQDQEDPEEVFMASFGDEIAEDDWEVQGRKLISEWKRFIEEAA